MAFLNNKQIKKTNLVLHLFLGIFVLSLFIFFLKTQSGLDPGNQITGFVTIDTNFTVYVDPTYDGSNGASDGSIERPYTSWSNFTIVNGGAYLQKRGTVANMNSITYASNNVIGAYGSGARPILNSTTTSYVITGDNQENVLIENLEIINTPYPNGTRRGIAIRFLHNFKNMYVDNCVIHGGGQAISASYGNSDYYPYNLSITNSEMYNLSTDAAYVQGLSGLLNFSNNYIHDINMAWFEVGQTEDESEGDGLQLVSHQFGQVEIFASNNLIDRTNAANKFCIILVGNYSGIVENNTCLVNPLLVTQTRVSGYNFGHSPGPIIFRYNWCIDCNYGLYNNARNITSYGNVLVNNGIGMSIQGASSSVRCYASVYNNVFYNSATRDIASWASNITLYNNIFYSDSPDHAEFSGVADFVASDYNLFNTPFDTGMDANSILDDPLFNDAANYDFSLHEGSPAINAGIDVHLARDIIGTSIPQGSAPDIGAYEFIEPGGSVEYGNLSVVASGGGSVSGSAINFVVPMNRSINASASVGYNFSNWTKTSGDCTINDSNSNFTTVQVNSGWCYVQANFIYIGATVSNGGICTQDINCSSGNCDADFSGVMRCHATATSCVINSTGTEISNGAGICSNQYQYRSCNNAVWSSTVNVTNGYVCSSGVSVVASGNTNCGTGAQNCSCSVYRDCVVGSCVASEYYVGFGAGGVCSAVNWQSKGSVWNVSSGYRISVAGSGASCTVVNTGGVLNYSSCSNQYTRFGVTGYCNGLGANQTASVAVNLGEVCRAGDSIAVSQNSNCGTGAQSCYCADNFKQCDAINDCTHDVHLVGFNSTGGCDSTNSVERLSNVANTDTYVCRANTDATLCVGMCASLFNISPCNGSSFYCSLGICENTEVNHAPTIENQSFSIQENSDEGTFIGKIIATDVDEGQNITYSIIGGNYDDAFRVDSISGNLYVNNDVLDFESDYKFYNLIILVEDNYAIPANNSATIIIEIIDVSESSGGGGGGSRSSSSYIPKVVVNSTNISYSNGVWSFSKIIAENQIELNAEELDLGLTHVTFVAKTEFELVTISIDANVQEKELLPDDFNPVYYFKINSNKLTNSDIDSSELRFKLSRNLNDAQDIQMEDIVLLKLNNGKWEKVNVSLRDLDNDNYYLESQTQMYGSFALGLKMDLVEKELTSPELILENDQEQQEIDVKISNKKNKGFMTGALIIVIILIIVSVLGIRKGKDKNKSNSGSKINSNNDKVNAQKINKTDSNNNMATKSDLDNQRIDSNHYYGEILPYVEERLRQGESPESLRPKLIRVGWLARDVDAIFDYFKDKIKPEK